MLFDRIKKPKASDSDKADARNKNTRRRNAGSTNGRTRSKKGEQTAIQRCVEQELVRYFELLDGQAPHDMHRMVMSQVESTLIEFVLDECGNNQSRAAEYLGISRGTLRSKLNEL